MNLFSFYEGKKVLICGASGMTGHNLYDLMHMLGAEVTGTCHSRNDYYADGKPMFDEVDFTLDWQTEEYFKSHQFDYVFICCAKTYNAKVCQENPSSMILPNLNMVSNILENCKNSGVKRVLYVSSATVYQPSFKVFSEEDMDWNKDPDALYMGIGWVKRYIEKLCQFYSSVGLEVVVVRPTNIYGRYDKTDENVCHVVPALIMRALKKEPVFTVWGSGRAIKNFIHANDLVRDMAKVMAMYSKPDPINLCGDEEISILELVHTIINKVQKTDLSWEPELRFLSYNPDLVPYRGLSRNKFDSLFGKESYIPIKKGMGDVVEWYSLSHQTQKQLTTV